MQHDATAWEPTRSFDLVAVFYLQLPQPGPNLALTNALAAVARGGTFLLVTHDVENLDHGYGGPPTRDVLYSVDEVVTLATSSGFTIVTAEQAERPVVAEDGEHVAIDTVVRAQRSA